MCAMVVMHMLSVLNGVPSYVNKGLILDNNRFGRNCLVWCQFFDVFHDNVLFVTFFVIFTEMSQEVNFSCLFNCGLYITSFDNWFIF